MPDEGNVEGSTWPMSKFRFEKYLNENASKTSYDRSSMYIQVAKFNNLNKFRNLSGGSQLIFPPIIPGNRS